MINEVFRTGGWLSQQISSYRPRAGQIMMAKAVDSALERGRHLLAEGPTGTGKSLAYGVPAALHSFSTSTSVVIATANITLQEQLYNKDIPLIAKVLGGNAEFEDGPLPALRFQLLKGMGNYLCLDKLHEIVDSGKALDPDYLEIEKWAHTTKTGDKSELLKEYPGHVWSDVCATSEECTKGNCRHVQDCFVFKMRHGDGSDPHLVVTNYHMLYTDMVVREATGGKVSFLPPYHALIMDEAHEAVDIAMSFNGFELTMSKMKWLSRLLYKLDDHAANIAARALTMASEKFFDALAKRESHDIIRKPLGFDGGLVSALMDAADYIKKNVIVGEGTESAERTNARLKALEKTYLKRAKELSEITAGEKLPEGKVYYVEKDDKAVKLCCKAVNVQEFLRKNVFSTKTLVATSATLSTGGDFDFIAEELGLNPREYEECQAPHPFNPERVLLIVPAGLPAPKQQEQHTAAVAKVIERLVNDLQGRTMALFTSYRALNQVAKYLRGKVKVRLLLQGELPKSRIIEEFKKDSKSVILATSSFWQGVDIPGQALSCVVVDKFPFLPPSDPVLKYMEEKMEGEGGSAFFDYSLPKAIIALKQGIGRLIRTEDDYGVIVLCDTRIDTTGYGRQFNKALPEGCFRSENGDLGDAKAFLDEMEKTCTTKPPST